MNTGIKIFICTVLGAVAVTMAVFTLSGFSQPESSTEPESYVLGEANGSIAIYSSADLGNPLSVTDIEIDSLREADRELILDGLSVDGESELMKLLEDLGS